MSGGPVGLRSVWVVICAGIVVNVVDPECFMVRVYVHGENVVVGGEVDAVGD